MATKKDNKKTEGNKTAAVKSKQKKAPKKTAKQGKHMADKVEKNTDVDQE